MNPENKFFIVKSVNGLNVRSKGEVEIQYDLGDFNLASGDIIHAVGAVVSNSGTTFHKIDRIYRGGTRYDYPFIGFPMYEASPTGEFWAAEKGVTSIWMTETNDPELINAVPISLNKPVNDPQHTSAPKYVGWRVLHQAEGGYPDNPLTMPEVIPPLNFRAVEMTESIQQMSYELMRYFNSNITAKLWSKVHDHDRAFTNFNGFDKTGDPRANFILGTDLSRPLPKYDKAQRLCGGQFVRGEVRSDKLVCIPGVHGIDAKKPMPTLDTIIANNWYLYAITLYSPASKVGHFPQGQGGPVVIPFIFAKEIEFKLVWFERWESTELPDPLKMYKTS